MTDTAQSPSPRAAPGRQVRPRHRGRARRRRGRAPPELRAAARRAGGVVQRRQLVDAARLGHRPADLPLGARPRHPDPGRRRRAGLPGLRVRRRRARGAGRLRRLHVRRQPVGGPAGRRRPRCRSAPPRPWGSGSPSCGTPGSSATTCRRSTSTATAPAASAGRAWWCWSSWCRSWASCSSRSARSCWPGCPAFDDMIDGLTFGVAAGAAFAAAETIVVNRGLFSQLRPGRRAQRRLLGLADPLRGDRQADRLRRRHRHRGGQLLRARAPATTASSPATSAAWPRRWSPTSCSRAGCSSRPGSRAPPAASSGWSGAG